MLLEMHCYNQTAWGSSLPMDRHRAYPPNNSQLARQFWCKMAMNGNSMIVLQERPELDVGSGYAAQPSLERTDISFQDLAGDRVRIQIMVHNEGPRRSRRTIMRLESAPLGAFVPWQPLAVLPVPPLEPGESRELRTEVPRPHPAPLGDFSRIPPKRLLTAVNSPDQPSPPSGTGLMAVLNLLRRGQTARPAPGSVTAKRASLAPDLWELAGRGQPYWAGNINVFIGAHPVERHRASALRVYPSYTNLAMFLVGGPGRPDAYAFDLLGSNPDWKAALYDVTNNRTLLADPSAAPIQEMQWVEANGGLMVMLVTHPPAGCRVGNVEVHVTRRSCQKTAVVEFNLDPSAQGSGCYFV